MNYINNNEYIFKNDINIYYIILHMSIITTKDYLFYNDERGLQYKGDSKTFDEIYKNLEDPWGQSDVNDKYYLESRKKLVKIITMDIDKDKEYKILEIGCGNGYSTNNLNNGLKDYNVKITGCDVSKEAIHIAKTNYKNMDFFQHNIENAFSNGMKYDIIIISNLLWYILNKLKECFDNCFDILSDDGTVIFLNAFLREQKYGKNIIDGFKGMEQFVKVNFPLNDIGYSINEKNLKTNDRRYFGLITLKKEKENELFVNKNNLIVKKAKQQYIYDVNDEMYIDLRLGAGSMILGHANKYILDKIKDQVDEGILFGTKSFNAEQLNIYLKKLMPWYDKFIFCNTGSESIMRIFRIARSYTGKNKIGILSGCWHGSYDQTLIDENEKTKSLQMKILSSGLSNNILNDIIVLPKNISEMREIIKENRENLSMIFIEPVQQNVPNINVKEYLQEIRKICDENKILLGFDEIITGFRFIPNSSQKYFDVYSDMACFGKIISGGLPIGIIGIKKNINEHLNKLEKKVFFGGTFSGNPLSTRICYETINYLVSNNSIYDVIKKKVLYFSNNINNYCKENNINAQIMHAEYFFRYIFTDKKIITKKDRYEYEMDKHTQKNFYNFLLKNKIFIGSNPLCFFSYLHTEENMEYIIKKTKEGLEKYCSKNLKEELKYKGIIKLNSLFNNDILKKVNEYLNNLAYCDKEPFSRQPYRATILKKDLNKIDGTILDRILYVVKKYLGDDFKIKKVTAHFKDKWLGCEEHWHQDYNYNKMEYEGEYDNFFRIFIAIDEHEKENGCMMFIPQKNTEYEEMKHDRILSIHSYQKYRTEVNELNKVINNNPIEYYPLKGGECLLFNSLILHSSHSNQSNLRRRALQIQLVKDGTKEKNTDEKEKILKERRRFEMDEIKKRLGQKVY